MDTLMERSNYVQAFQRQLGAEMAPRQEWAQPRPAAPVSSAARKVTLRDGTALTLRPLQPDDMHLLWQMHQRVSATSLYYRYLHAHNPSPAELAQICDLKREEGGALVATSGRIQKQIVALAYYLVDKRQPTTAGVAFLVEDRYQGRGLGKLLLHELSRHAREHGVTTFEAAVHPSNTAMLRIIRKSGLPQVQTTSYELREIELQISQPQPV
jgi:RimJ/RimL family protein N-acetyltransferase